MLGLRMHTALHEAGELVSKRLGKKVDVLSLPPDDKDTYALVRTGHNIGMFQLESPGQQALSRRLKARDDSPISWLRSACSVQVRFVAISSRPTSGAATQRKNTRCRFRSLRTCCAKPTV